MSDAELVMRLEKLERDNRRMKRLGLAALVLAAALGLMAATRPVPDHMSAHAFYVVNKAGKTVGVFGASESGAAVLGLFGPKGIGWGYLGLNGFGGPAILLFDPKGDVPNASMFVESSGEPGIRLTDPRGFMDLGTVRGGLKVDRRTGKTSEFPAANIMMFGNDKKHTMIWAAPGNSLDVELEIGDLKDRVRSLQNRVGDIEDDIEDYSLLSTKSTGLSDFKDAVCPILEKAVRGGVLSEPTFSSESLSSVCSDHD